MLYVVHLDGLCLFGIWQFYKNVFAPGISKFSCYPWCRLLRLAGSVADELEAHWLAGRRDIALWAAAFSVLQAALVAKDSVAS